MRWLCWLLLLIMPLTISHALSATTPDDPAYEIQVQHWNSNHAVTFTPVGSEISGAFSNANGLSFGLEAGGGITGSYTVPSLAAYLTTARGSTDAIGLNTALTANGVSWTANSSGLSLNFPAFLTTAQAPGAYLTTARASNDAVGLATALTANGVAWTVNSAGISLNVPAFLTTAQAPGAYLTTARGSTDAIGLNTALTANGVSWTANSSGLSLNVPAFLTTAMASNRGTDFVQATAAFAGTNASGTINSTGISVSVAAPGGGANLSGFEPFHLFSPLTTTYAPGIGSWYFQPFVAPAGLASGRLNILVSFSNSSAGILRASNGASFASNTTGTRSISYVLSDKMALYSRGAGANSTRMESFWSNTWSVGIFESVSVILTAATQVRASLTASVSYIASVGSDGAYTTAMVSGSGSLSSASASMATSAMSSLIASAINVLSGQILQPMGFNTSIPAGMYWLAQQWSTASTTGGTTGGDPLPFVNQLALTGISSMQYRPFGATVSNTSSQFWPGAGVYSAASAVPPPTVPFADIRSIAGHLTQYFNHINIPS